jgi:hypothetical protein
MEFAMFKALLFRRHGTLTMFARWLPMKILHSHNNGLTTPPRPVVKIHHKLFTANGVIWYIIPRFVKHASNGARKLTETNPPPDLIVISCFCKRPTVYLQSWQCRELSWAVRGSCWALCFNVIWHNCISTSTWSLAKYIELATPKNMCPSFILRWRCWPKRNCFIWSWHSLLSSAAVSHTKVWPLPFQKILLWSFFCKWCCRRAVSWLNYASLNQLVICFHVDNWKFQFRALPRIWVHRGGNGPWLTPMTVRREDFSHG